MDNQTTLTSGLIPYPPYHHHGVYMSTPSHIVPIPKQQHHTRNNINNGKKQYGGYYNNSYSGGGGGGYGGSNSYQMSYPMDDHGSGSIMADISNTLSVGMQTDSSSIYGQNGGSGTESPASSLNSNNINNSNNGGGSSQLTTTTSFYPYHQYGHHHHHYNGSHYSTTIYHTKKPHNMAGSMGRKRSVSDSGVRITPVKRDRDRQPAFYKDIDREIPQLMKKFLVLETPDLEETPPPANPKHIVYPVLKEYLKDFNLHLDEKKKLSDSNQKTRWQEIAEKLFTVILELNEKFHPVKHRSRLLQLQQKAKQSNEKEIDTIINNYLSCV